MKLNKILVPIDFSSRTEAEVEHAVNIAAHLGGELVFLHVMPIFAGPEPVDQQAAEAYKHNFSADIEAGIKSALASLAQRVARGAEVECVISTGDPAACIEEVAARVNAGLIVMPTAGRGRFRRRLLGSATTKVLHDLSVPVFTGVHVQEIAPAARHPYLRIACKLDPAGGDERVLNWAKEFAAGYDAEFYLVSVLPFLDGLGAAPSLPEHMRPEALAKARDQLLTRASTAGVRAKAEAIGGPIEQVLPPYLKHHHIDLLITGRRREQHVVGILGLHRDLIDTVCCTPCPTISV